MEKKSSNFAALCKALWLSVAVAVVPYGYGRSTPVMLAPRNLGAQVIVHNNLTRHATMTRQQMPPLRDIHNKS